MHGLIQKLDIKKFMFLGPSHKSLERSADKIMGDCLEALIGAIYLDTGLKNAELFILNFWKKFLDNSSITQIDAKTQLQELMQASGFGLPQYNVVKIEGEAHQQVFHVECRVDGVAKAQKSSGTSKRNAEQGAAQDMLKQLKSRH